MDQKYFLIILKKYLHGQASAEERRIVDAWYANMDRDSAPVAGEEQLKLEEEYWSALSGHIAKRRKLTRHRVMVRRLSLAIAASFVLVLLSYVFLVSPQTSNGSSPEISQVDPHDTEVIANAEHVSKAITLPDNSRVTLQPKSQLSFSRAFSEHERRVILEGEAFFEVAVDAERPFFVITKNLTTRVLGTSFNIKAFRQDKDVIVEVKTGKVSVYTHDGGDTANIKQYVKTDSVILTPNQKIVYDKKENTLSKMIVDRPRALLPAEEIKRMRFEAAPVKLIFETIEKIYGVDIVFDEASTAACTLTTSISDGDIYNRLDIICAAIGARYELRDDQIVIMGPGCN